MLLAIDVGNTHTVLGVFSNDDRLVADFRVRTERERTSDELGGADRQPFRGQPGGHGLHRGDHHLQRGAPHEQHL